MLVHFQSGGIKENNIIRVMLIDFISRIEMFYNKQ